MRRVGVLLSCFVFVLAALSPSLAQNPVATEDVFSNNTTTTTDSITNASDAAPDAPPTPSIGLETPLLVTARSDLELLATTLLGSTRPAGWSGSMDVNDPQLALLTRLDLEFLVGALLGPSQRPAQWFGAVPSTPFAIARDIRHDLELLADETLGLNVRPPGWQGGEPIMRCGRAVQTLVSFLERAGVFVLDIDPAAPNYCAQAEIRATSFAEVNLLSDPTVRGANLLAPKPTPTDYTINTNFAVGFLDRGASLSVGVIPNGTGIVPVARSYAQFSNMMLVRGDGFELFVDYKFTSVNKEAFDALPDVSAVGSAPVCAADWCLAG